MDTILDTIGHTPILQLDRIQTKNCAALYAKYEAGNPTFSIKDRIAYAMIEKGLKEGKINQDTQIVVGTAGNTGVALAMVCAVKKLKLILFMPEDASLERRKMFEGFGAQLKITPKEKGIPGAIQASRDYAKNHPNTHYLSQFEDPVNPETHRKTTAQEICEDFPEGVDALVTGVGTGGTITGVGEVLKEKFSRVLIVAVEPSKSPVLSGRSPGRHRIQQLGHGFIPKNLKRSLVDRIITVTDSQAYLMAKRLSRKQGLLVGISSGAHVHGALQIAEELGEGKKVLTFLSDAGQRYFSIEQFFAV